MHQSLEKGEEGKDADGSSFQSTQEKGAAPPDLTNELPPKDSSYLVSEAARTNQNHTPPPCTKTARTVGTDTGEVYDNDADLLQTQRRSKQASEAEAFVADDICAMYKTTVKSGTRNMAVTARCTGIVPSQATAVGSKARESTPSPRWTRSMSTKHQLSCSGRKQSATHLNGCLRSALYRSILSVCLRSRQIRGLSSTALSRICHGGKKLRMTMTRRVAWDGSLELPPIQCRE